MEKNKTLKFSTVSTFFLILIALVVGIYLGLNNNFIKSKLANAANLNDEIPLDLQNQKSFSEFYEVWKLLEEKHIHGTETNTQEKMWGAISGMVDSLGDPYTVFLPPEKNESLNIDLKGEFSGVGMEVGIRDDVLTVISPLKDSPAEKAGVLAGDVILQIGDVATSDMDVDEAVDLIRGEKGTSVKMTIFRRGEETTRDIEIVREVIKLPVLETEYIKKDNVFVINLFGFGEKSSQEFAKALQKFADSGADKLILDLRNNPGGFLSAAVDISSWFLDENDVIVIEKGKTPEYNKTYTSINHHLEGEYKMAVLINGGSASASEITAGALQEHGKAKLVGTQSFGKGSVQELIPLEKSTALKVTVAEWLTPNGKSISKEGLTPDEKVELDREKLEKDEIDTQLQKAIEILK